MNPKILTEAHWKTTSLKLKIKGPELQKALAAYDKTPSDDHAARMTGILEIRKHALNLKKSKEAASAPDAQKHLADLIAALEAEQKEVVKQKAAAEKSDAEEKKQAAAKADNDAEADEEEQKEDDGEDEQYAGMLLKALQKLKSGKGDVFEFIVCDGKPLPAVMIAKKISPKHKEQLAEVAGSKRFLHVGRCHAQDGKFAFEMDKPVSGLAQKLQASIKHHTGKKFPIVVGNEVAGEDDETARDGKAEAAPAPKLPRAELSNAPQVWHGTRDLLEQNINALKSAIRKQCADQADDFVDKVNADMEKMGAILEKLDTRLAHSLEKAHGSKDAAARSAELKKSKGILTEYISYVKAEPLIAHIDANPFGVKTNLKAILAGSLTHMAQAIA